MLSFQLVASTVAGAFFLWLLQPLITANVKKAIESWGWDKLLLRLTERVPIAPLKGLVLRRQATAQWARMRRRWWLWMLFGASAGIAVALWAVPKELSPEAVIRPTTSKPPPPARQLPPAEADRKIKIISQFMDLLSDEMSRD